MVTNQHFTYQEIISQTEAWKQAIDLVNAASLPLASDYELVLFTGCGSTYYLALAGAALYQELTGRTARAVPGGELLLNSQTVIPAGANSTSSRILLIALSRSGTTTETVKAVEKLKGEQNCHVIVISNYGESLSLLGDTNIIISKGQEESVAQTRSFASMYVAVTALCACMAKRNDLLEAMLSLPEVGQRLIKDFGPEAYKIGQDLNFDRFYFLGSGTRYGLACEISLKMKEMSLTHSEPFHFLEFRHGPKSMVNANTVVVGFLSDTNFGHEKAVLNEVKALGGKTLELCETGGDIPFESNVSELVRGVLYLPILQLSAYYRSLAKNLNPDRPNNLTSVVELELSPDDTTHTRRPRTTA
jgi:glucosamine--fructose-6-phosphate aminotransferase (isomerizing)